MCILMEEPIASACWWLVVWLSDSQLPGINDLYSFIEREITQGSSQKKIKEGGVFDQRILCFY